MHHQLHCTEIWGGTGGDDTELVTSGLQLSLFAQAADGARGGDIYYVGLCANDRITRIALADVMGHGEAVSRRSEELYTALHRNMNNLDGNEVLNQLNQIAEQRGPRALTTAALVSFYRPKSQLLLSSAGHPPVLQLRHQDRRWRVLELEHSSPRANMALGVVPETTYDQLCQPVSSGDRFFLYTDGVTEAPDRDGRQLGQERLIGVLDTLATSSLSAIKAGVRQALLDLTGGSLAHDDVTFLAIEVQ